MSVDAPNVKYTLIALGFAIIYKTVTAQLTEKYKSEHDWTAEYGLETRRL